MVLGLGTRRKQRQAIIAIFRNENTSVHNVYCQEIEFPFDVILWKFTFPFGVIYDKKFGKTHPKRENTFVKIRQEGSREK